MSDHNEEQELNFSELIGNLLSSHNEDDEVKSRDKQEQEKNDKVDITENKEHDVVLPDLEDDDVGEADFVSGVPDFASVVSNALHGMKPTDDASHQQDKTPTPQNEESIDERQQREWAHILQQGLLQDDHDIGDSALDDEVLDQDDENLRRAILESLQGLNNTSTNEPPNKTTTLENEIPQVEIIRKSTKKPSKKQKKKQAKDKNSKTSTASDKVTEDKQSKKKKNRKDKEKAKSKSKAKANNEDDHLIEIDDVIRGIMGQTQEEEQTGENDDDNKKDSTGSNDNNEAETKALVEATLKAFEKQLMTSEPTPTTTKPRKIVSIPKRLTPKPKPKAAPKKTPKSSIPPIPTPFIGHTDLNYEIPVSTFYPQPKKPSTTTTTKKKTKKPKAGTTSPNKKTVSTASMAESDTFQDDEFSKVLAEMVNQVVETSLSEPITEKETIIPKPIVEPSSSDINKKPVDKEEKEKEQEENSWNIPFPLEVDVSATHDEAEADKEKKQEEVQQQEEANQREDDDEEEDDDDEDEAPFDLNQIMQNAMTLAFESKSDEMKEEEEEEEEEEEAEDEEEETENEKEQEEEQENFGEHDKREKLQVLEESEEAEKLVTLEEPKEGKILTEIDNISQPEKIDRVKKPKKAKKVPKLKKSETEKIKKPPKVKVAKPKAPKKKSAEVEPRKKYETIIIDSFQKKLPSNSINDVANSIRKLNAQSRGKMDKNREIIIRNVEVERRFTKLKNGIMMKPQSPQLAFKKKFSLIAEAAANEARKRHREKNKQLRLKLKEEREKIREAKKAQKELDQAQEDAEQKELEEIVAKGPPYPPDLKLTKKGIPKKPYRKYSPEEMALRAQLEEDTYGEIEDRLRTLHYNKRNTTTVRKSPLFNFIKQNLVLEDKNLSNIEEALKKIGLPQSYFEHLVSKSGTLGYSYEEIIDELKIPGEDTFNPKTKTIVHRERFLFHAPWSLPDHPPIALPIARRSIINKNSKSKTNNIPDDSAFMAMTRKLIPNILNPIINTLKTAAKKRIADGASPEEATRHLLTIINHTKKSIALVIANARRRQLREPLARIKQEMENSDKIPLPQPSINIRRIPLLNSFNHKKRTLSNANLQNIQPKQEVALKMLPLIPLPKKAKTDVQPSTDVIVIDDKVQTSKDNNLSTAVTSSNGEQTEKNQSVISPSSDKIPVAIEPVTIEDRIESTVKEKFNTADSFETEKNTKESSVAVRGTIAVPNKEETNIMVGSNVAASKDHSYPVNINAIDESTSKTIENGSSELDTQNKSTVDVIGKSSESTSVSSPRYVDILSSMAEKATSHPTTPETEVKESSNGNSSTTEVTELTEKIPIQGENSDPCPNIPLLVKNVTKSIVAKESSSNQNHNNEFKIAEGTVVNNITTSTRDKSLDISTEKLKETSTSTDQGTTLEDHINTPETIPEGTEPNPVDTSIRVKTENQPGLLKKIPINASTSTSDSSQVDHPVKVESIVKSLVAQQLQDSNGDGEEILPDGITNIITSTLTNLLPEIQNDFIKEEKRQRRSGPNSVFNLDGLVPPPLISTTTAIPRIQRSPSVRKASPPRKPKKEKRTFQAIYSFEVPDFSNVAGKKNILQKKLKEFLSSEEFDTLRRDISTERKRRWRDANAIQNKINELRMRVKKRANKTFDVEDTKDKLEWIDVTFKQKCDEAGFTDFLKQKTNNPDKKDSNPISDNDILNMVAINLNKLDVARKIENALTEESKEDVGSQRKKRKLNKDNVTNELSHIQIAASVSNNL